MADKKCKKAINFDLDTKALKQYYPNQNYRQAYKDVKKFLLQSGFKHRQWSGYVSKETMNSNDVVFIIGNMFTAFPWLNNCIKRLDVTDVGKTYDLMFLASGSYKPSKNIIKNKTNKIATQKNQEKESLESRFARAKSISQSISTQRKEVQDEQVHKRDDMSR